eukprot:c16890_g1_i1 orf=330-2063(+)
MEQTTHLKQTVEKLDLALARLQEIQSTLRGYSVAESPPDITHHRKAEPQIPRLRRFHELYEIPVDQSGRECRRWSLPARPPMHDALSDAVAASKFAKKTVDMVKVQKKQAAKSTNSSYISEATQTSLLHPSNKANLPRPLMATPTDNTHSKAGNSQPLPSCKENRRTHHQCKLDLKDDATKGLRSSMRTGKQKGEKCRPEEASSSLHAPERFNARTSSTKVAPEEDVIPNIIQLRTLTHVEEATTSDHDCQGAQHTASDRNTQGHSGHASAPVMKRSSLSMRTLMQIEDKEKILSRPAVMKDEEDADSFSSSMAPKSFCVQLEEVKSSRKKPWSFSQGKVSDNVVVMFPNPTFDETTPPMSTPPDVRTTTNMTIEKNERASTSPPSSATINKDVAAYPPLDKKASTQKREKIVRLAPCSTTSNARKPKPQPAPTGTSASASKRASPKKQKWLHTLTHPPSPTLIRRLPEAHEMEEIRQNRVPSTVIITPSGSVGRPQNILNASKTYEEDRSSLANGDGDEQNLLKRSWSFGNPSGIHNAHTSSSSRRSSLGPPGGHSFSFLSKHFHAWKLASSKQDK